MYIHLCRFLCWKYHDCKLRDVNASIECFGMATLATLHHRNGGNDFPSVLNNRNLVIFFVYYTIGMAYLAYG
jgi:hypothetical protein